MTDIEMPETTELDQLMEKATWRMNEVLAGLISKMRQDFFDLGWTADELDALSAEQAELFEREWLRVMPQIREGVAELLRTNRVPKSKA